MKREELIALYAEGQKSFRNANLTRANLTGAYLSKGNLTSADLRSANLSGANLHSTDLEGVQVLFEIPSRAELLACLKKHAKSERFVQSEWCACLAGAAAEFVELPGNSGMGVIAIHKAIPEFDLDVLHQADPDVAIAELNRF